MDDGREQKEDGLTKEVPVSFKRVRCKCCGEVDKQKSGDGASIAY